MERTGDDGTGITSMPLDLSSFDSVRAFAAAFSTEACSNYGLNVLVANAGTKAPSSESPLHLVVVSGFGHHFGAGKLKNGEHWESVVETINDMKFCNSADRYNMSKLLQVMFVRELPARLPSPTPVVACTVQPGFCRSNLFRDLNGKWYARSFVSLMGVFLSARTREQGRLTLVHAAVGDDPLAVHGRYLSSCQVTEADNYKFAPEGKFRLSNFLTVRLTSFPPICKTETIDTLSKVDGRVLKIVKHYLRVD